MAKPAKHDWAYVAGLIDGEGSVKLQKSGGATWRYPCISLPSSSEELIDYLVTTFGGAKYKNKVRNGHKQTWSWVLRSKSATAFMQRVLPWLRENSKVARIKLILFEYPDVLSQRDPRTFATFVQRFHAT